MKLVTRRLQTSLNTIMFSGRNGIHSQVSLIIFGFHNSINLFNSYYAEYDRIAQRIAEGEAKRNKQDALWRMLSKKIQAVKYPMQELELNYPTTKGKIYSEEEDRYLLCRLHHYGLKIVDVYERIKRDITEPHVFRFDWFFKSMTLQELQRRYTMLLGLIEKEANQEQEEVKVKGRGRNVWRMMQIYLLLQVLKGKRISLTRIHHR